MAKKKLIEVALPLDAINEQSAREKSIRHGHPSTLHLWWARRPLATARAVLFAQLVDDPSAREDEFRDEALLRGESDIGWLCQETLFADGILLEKRSSMCSVGRRSPCSGTLVKPTS